jgi:hypothetical protein
LKKKNIVRRLLFQDNFTFISAHHFPPACPTKKTRNT